MREIAKSTLGLSWALSLLGLSQAAVLFAPRGGQKTQDQPAWACDSVAEAALKQMDPSLQGLFRTGNSFQRGMVDLAFGLFSPADWARGSTENKQDASEESQPQWGPVPQQP